MYRIFFIVILFCLSYQTVLAVPPPDFLFQIGSSIVQVFSIIAFALTFVIGMFYRFFKMYFIVSKHKIISWLILGGIIIALSFIGAYIYDFIQQQRIL